MIAAPTKHTSTISPAELLQRDVEFNYSKDAIRLISGKTILVTGAGGSIGSEIVKQLGNLGAKRIICLDRDEYALYTLQLKLTGSALLTDANIVLADIQDYDVISKIIRDAQPNLVFHAAAHKHLPLLEKSPASAILTNVQGSKNVIQACIENGVERMINISTDKAADPSSVLGMSKRLAEMVAKSYPSSKTLIASVRFGNVLGSRGSFFETLAWQIANAIPVTVTHPKITRYFMTIPQAASLVIEAAVLAKVGETYVLDMGSPVKILDLIERYSHLSGENMPEITFSGLRQGEKLHEVLFDPRESRLGTKHPEISVVEVGAGDDKFMDKINQLCELAKLGAPVKELRKEMEQLVA